MTTQAPPFAVWSDDDHSGPIIIVTTLCLFYWLVPGLVQEGLSLSRDFRLTYSGATFVLSMVAGVVQSALILVACHSGLGKSKHILQPRDVERTELYYYISNLCFILVLGLIKCSSAFFIANLTVNNLGSLRHASRKHKMALGLVLLATAIWTVASIVVLALPCASQVECVGTMRRWRGIYVGDAITDLVIALFAANVIWRTQAAFRVRLMWYFPYILRICVPLCAGMRLLTTTDENLTQTPTLAPWLLVIVSQIQIFLSLIGYTSPALKKTMLDLVTNYGVADDSQMGSRGYKGGSYAMKNLRYHRGSGAANAGSWHGSAAGKKLVPFASASSKAYIEAGAADRDSDGDSQKGIIRRDEVEISYAETTRDEHAK